MTHLPHNLQRGEIAAVLDGRPRRLRLTLGALAEIEGALGESVADFARRLDGGGVSARDAAVVIAAGLRGAGGGEQAEDAAAMTFDGGLTEAYRLVGRLFASAFPGGEA